MGLPCNKEEQHLASWGWGVDTCPLHLRDTLLQVFTFLLHTSCSVEMHKWNFSEACYRLSEMVLPHRPDCPHAENGGNMSALSKR